MSVLMSVLACASAHLRGHWRSPLHAPLTTCASAFSVAKYPGPVEEISLGGSIEHCLLISALHLAASGWDKLNSTAHS